MYPPAAKLDNAGRERWVHPLGRHTLEIFFHQPVDGGKNGREWYGRAFEVELYFQIKTALALIPKECKVGG